MCAPSNTDLVTGVYEAFARGDLDRVMAAMDPRLEWVTPPTLPWSRGRYEGTGGLAEYLRSFAGALADGAVEPQDFLEAGDRVVVLGHEHGRGAETGRPFRARFAHVWTLSEGRVTRMEGVIDTATVCRAVGERP